jgi:TfoX/Sxy family transcriptional regulator of competence genes
MAFDETLAARVRDALEGLDIIEKKMFGGLAFMLSGNMCVGISGDDLMVRIGPDSEEEALSRPGVRVFDMTGRPMRGWILVAASVLEPDDALSEWVERGVDFAGTLPAK